MSIQKLIRLLSDVPAGVIPKDKRDELFKLVVGTWDEFSGSGEATMSAWKILRDAGPEAVVWRPPCLSFVIDRHGGPSSVRPVRRGNSGH